MKIAEYLRKNPYINESQITSFERLCQLDIMDYSNIILKQWEHFKQFFGSKFETEKRFITLKDFRNAVKHIKEINFVLQKEAEAAVEWFSQVLKVVKNVDRDEPEESKVQHTKTPEPDEQIIARVRSDFVRKAVTDIPQWVLNEFPDGLVTHHKWAGDGRVIKIKKRFMPYYGCKPNYIRMELQHTTPEELSLLKEKLSKPDSIYERSNNKQVSFQVISEKDLELVQGILRTRTR